MSVRSLDSMFQIQKIKSDLNSNGFWYSFNILLTKSHVVNKRIWGSKLMHKIVCKPLCTEWSPPASCFKLKIEERDDYSLTFILKSLGIVFCDDTSVHDVSLIEVILIELLPKSYCEPHAFQLICVQRNKVTVAFYDVTPEDIKHNLCPEFSYVLSLTENHIQLKSYCDRDSKSYQWLLNIILPQFVKWGKESKLEEKNSVCNGSLALVSNEKYYETYNLLKLRYGKELVKIWPECTDPSKFVYEDVAIATYLLLLWADERNYMKSVKMQTFVDLGCGNGLLVYILTMEGHIGVGIDVRKRQIWDMYPKNIQLQVKTIIPSDAYLFPDTDWIIGNHSDELTPWVPVMAARSSFKCNFFLLPCCAYNFDGTKYQRQDSSKSQYMEYLNHIKKLCEDCGYKTDMDRLKIPSTKRICLVGRSRTYSEIDHNQQCKRIECIIDRDAAICNQNDRNNSWVKDFKAREATERVRNCTQIDKNVIELLVDLISKYLLEGCSLESNWSTGRTVEINELIKILPEDKLKVLKSECGGLQTLLKNHHHIFKVQSGKVHLRHPKTIEEVNFVVSNNKKKTNVKFKQRKCWFYDNHPKGCPLSDSNCSYLHVTS